MKTVKLTAMADC